MSWKSKLLQDFKLYAVTNIESANERVIQSIEQALQGGADVIQLRSKILCDRDLLEIGKEIRKSTLRLKKLFIINNRVDLALALDADGVHLGQEDMPILVARKLMAGKKTIIGVSTHNIKQAVAAEKTGADYIGFGPIYGTPTKPDYRPIGLDWINEVRRKIKIPFVCIGGIDQSNIGDVIQAGASRVAVVRAIFNQENPKAAAKKLKQRLLSCPALIH